jgi:hypothetical protein
MGNTLAFEKKMSDTSAVEETISEMDHRLARIFGTIHSKVDLSGKPSISNFSRMAQRKWNASTRL